MHIYAFDYNIQEERTLIIFKPRMNRWMASIVKVPNHFNRFIFLWELAVQKQMKLVGSVKKETQQSIPK